MMLPAVMQPLANHLWQSTLFAGAAWLAALALRKHGAHVRYWVWLAASVKFLVPLSALLWIGMHAAIRMPAPSPPAAVSAAWDTIAVPFNAAPLTPPVTAAPSPAPGPGFNWMLCGLIVWLCGLFAVAFVWTSNWRRAVALLRCARPVAIPLPFRAVVSDSVFEPGVFGIWRPVLLLPAGIEQQMEPSQWEAVVRHETAHVWRRDNLTSALHMLVEAIFWFHPLVWWMGTRLAEERERACDEAVLGAGSQPRDYAAGILRVCELYLQPPLACVAGVSGANLRLRIEKILSPAPVRRLGRAGMNLLLSAAAAVFIAPVLLGTVATQVTEASLPAFDAVSVKPFPYPNRPWHRQAQFDPQRLYIEGMAPIEMILLAYSLNQDQLMGLPDWAKFSHSSLYSITATTDKPASKDQMLLMLRRVLADRFHLQIEESDKTVPVWSLVVPPSGPKFKPMGPDVSCQSGVIGEEDMKKAGAPPDSLGVFHGCSIADLVRAFNGGRNPAALGRPVVDRTGLTGRYDLTVWETYKNDATYSGPGIQMANVEPFREAVQRELGLSLTPATAPYLVVNVMSIARPGADN